MEHTCIKCGVSLVAGVNCTQHELDRSMYRCRECNAKHVREYSHRTGRAKPMSKNPTCSSFLGIHVAERVLSHIFKNVKRMPNNNQGYDFICNKGKKIDVKSACRRQREKHRDLWAFHTRHNTIADYFLCLAFNNREELNPEYIWLIPGWLINGRSIASISVTTIPKWDDYALDTSKVTTCCNVLKED